MKTSQIRAALAALLIAWFSNAVNLTDGLDGLAAGLGLIAALAICLFSLGQLRELGGDSSYYPPALITVALAGACLGFLPHNFSPARIFMGDSGALMLGLLVCGLAAARRDKRVLAVVLIALATPAVQAAEKASE